MDAAAIIALVGVGVTVIGAVFTAAWWLSTKLAIHSTLLAPLAALPDRVTAVETKVEAMQDDIRVLQGHA